MENTSNDIEVPVQVMSQHDMNVNMGEICEQYDLEFWMWIPGRFDLADEALREKALRTSEATYKNLPRVDAVFYPGGDPGSNAPELVLPFIKELSAILQRYHPEAKIWLSPFCTIH